MFRRIFDGDEFGEDLGFDGPVAGFPSCAMLGLHEEVADIGEGGGALGRDAVGGEGLEEFAEDVIDINLGDEIAGGAGEFFEEIVFAVEGAAVDGGVVEAEAVVIGVGGHGTEFAVGEFKVAKVVRCVWSSVAHGEYLTKREGTDKYLLRQKSVTVLWGRSNGLWKMWMARAAGKNRRKPAPLRTKGAARGTVIVCELIWINLNNHRWALVKSS
jgi:hypothetical protein